MAVTEARLRDELYAHCRDEGIVDDIKSRLRAQLIARLNARTWPTSTSTSTSQQQGLVPMATYDNHSTVAKGDDARDASGDGRNGERCSPMLWERVVASLFCDYLRTSALQYTLSVFKPEVGARRKVDELSRDEVLSVLNLDTATPLGRRIRSLPAALTDASDPEEHGEERRGSLSLAAALFESLAEEQRRVAGCEATTQTWTMGEATLSSQLSTIDDRYKAKAIRESRAPYELLEERMQEYRKECDARVEAEVDLRTRRVREVELVAVRGEEAARYRALAEELRAELEEENNARSLSLQRREEASNASLRAKESRVEAAAYEHRQRMLAEREDLARVRESLRKEEQGFADRMRVLEERMARREEDVRVHERDIEAMRERGAGAADEVLMQRRAQMEAEHREKLASIERERAKIEQDRSAALDARSLAETDLVRASVDRRRAEVAEKAAMEADERCIAIREELLALKANMSSQARRRSSDDAGGVVGYGEQDEGAGGVKDELGAIREQLESARKHNAKLKRALQQALEESDTTKATLEKDFAKKLRQWQQRALTAEEMLEAAIDARDGALTQAEDLRLELRRAIRNANSPTADHGMLDSTRQRAIFDLLSEDPGGEGNKHTVTNVEVSEMGAVTLAADTHPDTRHTRASTVSSPPSASEFGLLPASNPKRPARDDAHDDEVIGTSIDAEIERRLKALDEEERTQHTSLVSLKHSIASTKTSLLESLEEEQHAREYTGLAHGGHAGDNRGLSKEDPTVPPPLMRRGHVDREVTTTISPRDDGDGDSLLVDHAGSDAMSRGGGTHPASITNVDLTRNVDMTREDKGGEDKGGEATKEEGNPIDRSIPPPSLVQRAHIDPTAKSASVVPEDKTSGDASFRASDERDAVVTAAAPTEGVIEKSESVPPPSAQAHLHASSSSPTEDVEIDCAVQDSAPRHDRAEDETRTFVETMPSRRDRVDGSEESRQLPSSSTTYQAASTSQNVPPSSFGGGGGNGGGALIDADESGFHGVSIIEKCEDDFGDGIGVDDSSIVRGVHDEIAQAVSKDDDVKKERVSMGYEYHAASSPAASDSESRRLQPLIAEDADEVEERLGSPSLEMEQRPLDFENSADSIGRLEVLPPDLPELEDDADDAELEAIDYEDIPMDDDVHLHHQTVDAEFSAGSFGQPASSTSEGSVF